MFTIEVAENDDQLDRVDELAKQNSAEVGFIARAIMEDYMRKQGVLIALDSNQNIVGYILYRIAKTKKRATLAYLGVDKQHRGKGIARQLIDELKKRTKHLHGINLHSKRTLSSHKIWPKFGFSYRSEKLGRGKDQETLTEYWFDHQHTSLLTLIHSQEIAAKPVQAVIDMNVFIDLFDGNHDSSALLADWVLAELALCTTQELRNEINNNDNAVERKKQLKYARTFPEVPVDQDGVDQMCYNLEKSYYSDTDVERRQHISDRRQLAHTILSDVSIFVTRDQKLLNLSLFFAG